MKTKDMFPSKYIQAKIDLMKEGRPLKVATTITGLVTESFDSGDKYVMTFGGTDKSLILNKTNYNTLMDLFPVDDTDEWVGKRVYLQAQEVDYMGKMVWGTRIGLSVPDEQEQDAPPVEDDDSENFPF